jgi:hypothetical protein
LKFFLILEILLVSFLLYKNEIVSFIVNCEFLFYLLLVKTKLHFVVVVYYIYLYRKYMDVVLHANTYAHAHLINVLEIKELKQKSSPPPYFFPLKTNSRQPTNQPHAKHI